MKTILVAFLLLMPCFVFGQSLDEKYTMYSDCLRTANRYYLDKGKGDYVFVVKVSTEYRDDRLIADVADIAKDSRSYLKGSQDNIETSSMRLTYGQLFLDTIKKDTLWLSLIDQLAKSMRKGYAIKNRFAPDLHVFIAPYNELVRYFDGHNYDWEEFHKNYSGNSGLVELSEVIGDGKRAVFYHSELRNPLNGSGGLECYYKDDNGWHFVMYIKLWIA